MTKPRSEEEIIEHLLSNSVLIEDTGCVLWQGSVAGKGYGVTCWEGKQVYIHRLVYKFVYPDEVINVIRHTCDTPNCWRIDHLINGTTQDNINDKVSKNRHPKGSLVGNSALKENQIIEIRNSTLNLYELARVYNVTPSNIHYIKTRKSWKHVP